jgi:hypothetical protein
MMENELGKATQGDSPPGNEGTSSGVSSVRGSDSANHIADLPGRGELPRMRPGDSDGNPSKVSDRTPKIGASAITDLTLEEKISVLNALKKIIHKPPKIAAEASVKIFLEKQYKKWVSGLIGSILNGEQVTETGFNEEETSILRMLIQQIQSKQTGSTSSVPVNNQKKQSRASTPTNNQSSINEKPLRTNPYAMGNRLSEAVNTDQFIQSQKNFLDTLSEMERQGQQMEENQRR